MRSLVEFANLLRSCSLNACSAIQVIFILIILKGKFCKQIKNNLFIARNNTQSIELLIAKFGGIIL